MRLSPQVIGIITRKYPGGRIATMRNGGLPNEPPAAVLSLACISMKDVPPAWTVAVSSLTLGPVHIMIEERKK